MARSILHAVVRFLFKVLARVHFVGYENLPQHGMAILASNHLSILDAPLVFAAVERKDLKALVAKTYRRDWFIGPLVAIAQSIWIDRDAPDLTALRAARDHLRGGGLLGIAPEGTRSRTGALTYGKTGAAYMAAKTGAPIIPIAIWGSEQAVPNWKRLRRAEIFMHIGAPFSLPPRRAADRSDALNQDADEIMLRIAAMLPPQYHGVYREQMEARLAETQV